MITKDTLLKYFDIDFNAGLFLWKEDRGRLAKKGDIAGSRSDGGYIRIKVEGKLYMAHRLMWLAATGEMPLGQIDHINGVRTDNRLINLRDVTPSENCLNRAARVDSTSRVPGVAWHKKQQRWVARLQVEGERIQLGSFKRFSQAVNARRDAEIKYGILTPNS